MGITHDDTVATIINSSALSAYITPNNSTEISPKNPPKGSSADTFPNNILFFAASSNLGATRTNPIAFPAVLSNVIAIGSTDGHGTPSSFNPRTIKLNILGEQVKSLWPTNLSPFKQPGNPESKEREEEKRQTGTSTATPIAAGIAALLLEFVLSERPFPILTTSKVDLQQLRRRLKTLDGMLKMLEYLVEDQWILPWKLLNARKGPGIGFSARDVAMLDLATHLLG